jgi:hypothetical protein
MLCRRNLMVVVVGFCSWSLFHVVDGWTCPPTPISTISKRRRTKYAIATVSVKPYCDRQRWSGTGWFSRERRLYSEPVVSTSTSSSAAAALSSSKSNSNSSNSNSNSNNVTSTTTVLPFMATTQSVATNKKTVFTNSVDSSTSIVDIPSSSVSATATASMTAEIIDTSTPSTDDTAAVATSPIVTNVQEDVAVIHPTQKTQSPSDIVDHDIDIHYMRIAIELAQLEYVFASGSYWMIHLLSISFLTRHASCFMVQPQWRRTWTTIRLSKSNRGCCLGQYRQHYRY